MGRFVISKDWRGNPVEWQTRVIVTTDDTAPSEPPGRLWGLWQHEVVEVFIAGAADDRYIELEMGPHAHYLALRFAGERNLVDDDVSLEEFEVQLTQSRWTCRMRIGGSALPERPWRFNAYSISGESDRRYCALFPQVEPNPDFHRLRYFRPLDC